MFNVCVVLAILRTIFPFNNEILQHRLELLLRKYTARMIVQFNITY